MEIQKVLYEIYEKSIGEEILEVKKEERKPAEEGQVRLFFFTPPEYMLVLKKDNDTLVIVPLTTYLQLAVTDKYPPLIKWRGFNLVPLPFWVHIHKKLIEKYSVPVFKIKDLERIKEYIKKARVKGIGEWREKFIKKVAQRYQDLNISTLIFEAMKAEEEGK